MKTNKNKSLVGSVITALTILTLAWSVGAQTPTASSGGGGGGGGGGGTSTVSIAPVTPPVIPSMPPPAPVLPIQSQVALREYALGSVVRGSRNVSAKSMDESFQGSLTHVETEGNGAEAVLDKLFSVQFKYKLANPNDKIAGYVYLYNKDNVLIFSGQADYSAAEVKAGNPPIYWIGINSIPLMSNVSFAEVLAINEDGVTVNTIRLNVNRGQIMFDPSMAGSVNGILAVRLTDGLVVTYKLSNPVVKGTTDSQETVSSWNIGGHHVFRGGAKLISVMELWDNPTVLLEVTSLDAVALDITGLVQNKGGVNTFERPLEMSYTQVNGTWAGAVKFNFDRSTIVTFPAVGTYRLRFEWKNFARPSMLYTGPENGGEKG